MQDIRELECSEYFNVHNFVQVTYKGEIKCKICILMLKGNYIITNL